MLDAGYGLEDWQEFAGLGGRQDLRDLSPAKAGSVPGDLGLIPRLTPGATFFCPLRGLWASRRIS